MAMQGFLVSIWPRVVQPASGLPLQAHRPSAAPRGARHPTVPLLAAGLIGLVQANGSRRRSLGRGPSRGRLHALPATVPPAAASSVIVMPDADAVASSLCKQVAKACKDAVAERGAFALAIPGGSILKMLAGGTADLEGIEWDKGVMAYVNHKCVSNDDAAATHKKEPIGFQPPSPSYSHSAEPAMDLFLSGWPGLKVITMGGSGEGEAEAQRYEAELKALPETTLPRKDGMPVFDICLIGVGDDGHFGSLYPGCQEIADESGRWVLPVDMKSPPSITLSPKAMMAAKTVLVASAGVSEKYPMGKSEAMKTAIEGMEGPQAFPAQILRSTAQWLLDEAAASKLSPEYRS